ncbi:hypothetical protein PFISCL1PPCAC_19780, partial [Pristionchus fissidentatus]
MEDREEISIVELLGWSEGGRCGYCKDSKGGGAKRNLGEAVSDGEKTGDTEGRSVSLGCAAYSLSVSMFDRYFLCSGWSRSGSYLYKPHMETTCCPQYTIRLDVDKFVLSRTQKRVLKNMQLYLKHGTKVKGEKEERAEGRIVRDGKKEERREKKEEEKGEKKKEKGDRERGEKKKGKRRMRAQEKWIKKGLNVEEEKKKRAKKEDEREKSLKERIGEGQGEGYSHQLDIELVKVGSEEYEMRADEEYEIFKMYQESIHSDEDVSRRGFDRFLVRSPLTSSNSLLGSFHMRYLLDGRLIAVGVVDVLSESVSAKYLFYHPQYSFLSLGTYTALREIQLVRRLKESLPQLRYYYMGYYIADCAKMRYKGSFRPSDLLCDRSLTWCPLSECTPLLSSNSNSFTVFFPSLPLAPRLNPSNAKLYQSRRIVSFDSLPLRMKDSLRDKLESFCRVSTPAAANLVLVMKELQIEEEEQEEEEEEE